MSIRSLSPTLATLRPKPQSFRPQPATTPAPAPRSKIRIYALRCVKTGGGVIYGDKYLGAAVIAPDGQRWFVLLLDGIEHHFPPETFRALNPGARPIFRHLPYTPGPEWADREIRIHDREVM